MASAMLTGYLDRALSLARELAEPAVLAGFAILLHREGDAARGRGCLAEAARLLEARTGPDVDAIYAARLVAEAAGVLADRACADAMARWATKAAAGLGSRNAAEARIRVVAAAGLVDEALASVERETPRAAELFIMVAREATSRGESGVARRAFELALEEARRLEGRDRGWRLRDVAEALAEAGEQELLRVAVAEAAAVAAGERSMTVQLAVLFGRAGEHKAAAAAVKRMPRAGRPSLALAVAVGAHGGSADREALRRAAREARAQAATLSEGRDRVSLLCHVAEALASVDDRPGAVDALVEAGGLLPPTGAEGLAPWLVARFCRLAFELERDGGATPLRRHADEQLRALTLDAQSALDTLQAAWGALEAGRQAEGAEAGALPDLGRWDGPLANYVQRAFGAALACRQAGRLEEAAALACGGLAWLLRGHGRVHGVVHIMACSALSQWGPPSPGGGAR